MPGTVRRIIRATLEDAPDVAITVFVVCVMLIKSHSLAQAAARNGFYVNGVLCFYSNFFRAECVYICATKR